MTRLSLILAIVASLAAFLFWENVERKTEIRELNRRVDLKDSLFAVIVADNADARTAATAASYTLGRANDVLDEIEMLQPEPKGKKWPKTKRH